MQFYPKDGPPVSVSGGQISALADVPRSTYTLPNGRRITVAALTIRGLLESKSISPREVAFVKIGRNHIVRQGQFGSGLLSDDGTTTRYFLAAGGPVRNVASARVAPLVVFVQAGARVARHR